MMPHPDCRLKMSNKNRLVQGEKLRGADKVRRIPIKVIPTATMPRKPDWIRVRIPADPEISRIREILRRRNLASVCEEASCPNLPECFSNGTATFMIMGEICTRRCPFCDVAHGSPNPLDPGEPRELAEARRGNGVVLCCRYPRSTGMILRIVAQLTLPNA